VTAPSSDLAAIRQTIRALRAAGWTLDRVYVGDDEDQPVSTETEAIAVITAVDDAYLYVKRGDETGWVRFVMGNDPDEVICDHTLTLSAVLDPLTDGWFE
jgi:hypothetical protein